MADDRTPIAHSKRSRSDKSRSLAHRTPRASQQQSRPRKTVYRSSSPLTAVPTDLSSVPFTSPFRPTQRSISSQSHFAPKDTTVETPQARAVDNPPITSSFASHGGSQRIERNGEIIITGSDDDDSIGSLDEAEDLLDILFPPLPIRSSPSKQFKKTEFKAPYKPKYSFDDLIADTMKDRASEAKVVQAKSTMKCFGLPDTRDAGGKSDDRRGGFEINSSHDNVLGKLVGDETDSTAIQRLKNALARTEAFDANPRWSFFQRTPRIPPTAKFPGRSIDPTSWEYILRDPESRDRAFISGMLDDSLQDIRLNDDILLWILHAIALEPREDLRYGYCHALKMCPRKRVLSAFGVSDLDQLFISLGAQKVSLSQYKPLQTSRDPNYRSTLVNNQCLASVVSALAILARRFDTVVREHALLILLHLAMDGDAMDDPNVAFETQGAIGTYLNLIPEFDRYRILRHMYRVARHPSLQASLVQNIVPLNPDTALFRCRLATAFFMRKDLYLEMAPEKLVDLKRIIPQLGDERFQVNKRRNEDDSPFDYWELGSIIVLLNAVMDSAGAFITSEGRREFDHDLDQLAIHVKALYGSIQDTGAAHLKRIEVKDLLQGLHDRIIYIIRTKPQPKKSVFSKPKKGKQLQLQPSDKKSAEFMKRFTQPQKGKSPRSQRPRG
ncbi:hypothetical protein FQN57_003666 [Myotisia sp. PD_48]|nr:hypothetical protein FQN57_003666 [Myotisia sp. PD_48]